jgi:hypothetical protein
MSIFAQFSLTYRLLWGSQKKSVISRDDMFYLSSDETLKVGGLANTLPRLKSRQRHQEQALAGDEGTIQDLDELDLDGLRSLIAVQPIRASRQIPSLKELWVTRWSTLDKHTALQMPNLEFLRVDTPGWGSPERISLGWLPPNMAGIRFSGNSVQDPERLPDFENLVAFGGSIDPSILARCSNLRRLAISSPPQDYPEWRTKKAWKPAFAELSEVEEADLCALQLTDCKVLGNWSNLRSLQLEGTKSLAGLENLRALEVLWLDRHGRLPSLEPLRALSSLWALSLRGTDAPFGLDPIGSCSHLKYLFLWLGELMPATIPGLGFCSNLAELERLMMVWVKVADRNLAPLFDLPKLRFVSIFGGSPKELDRLRARGIEVQVDGEASEDEEASDEAPYEFDKDSGEWSIFGDYASKLDVASQHEVEEILRKELSRRFPDLLTRLTFDSEAGALSVRAKNESDIAVVSRVLSDVAVGKRPDRG